MSKSGFVFGSSSIDLDDIFQKSVSATPASITSELGYRTANDIDIVNRYRAIAKNTYGTATNFLTKDGTDLSAIFEWGGFTPTVVFPSVITTITATFTISGNYFKITFLVKNFEPNSSGFTDDIHSSIDYSSNPYTIQITGLVPNKTYPFTIIAYNPFFTKTQTINSSFITNGEPIFTRISLLGGDKTFQLFSFDGDNLHSVRYTINGTINVIDIKNQPLTIYRTGNYSILFGPLNAQNDQGNLVTKSITFGTTEINSTTNSPPFSYQASVILIGGGGSGGSGGTKKANAGWGGGGGGGGSGGRINQIYSNLPSNQTSYAYNIVVGAGATGADARTSVSYSSDGHTGRNGLSSSIQSDKINLEVTGGFGGNPGNGGGSETSGGGGGSPDGFTGGTGSNGTVFLNNTHAPGGQGASVSAIPTTDNTSTYGRGSNGSAGEDNSTSTGETSSGTIGYCKITFKHIIMTPP